jgi:chromate transporter
MEATADGSSRPELSLGALFGAFLRIALSGFGGTLPWARRILVDERHWLSDREFVDALSLCQFLPGPNVVNLSVVVGQRFRGPAGSITALAGLILAPFAIVLVLAALYARYGHAPVIDRTLGGISAAAAGLVWAMALQMARPFAGIPRAVIFAALAFIGSGIAQLPILAVIVVLAPLSVGAAWLMR